MSIVDTKRKTIMRKRSVVDVKTASMSMLTLFESRYIEGKVQHW